MLTIKTIIDNFKALTTIKKAAVVIIILAVCFIIFKMFSKSSFGEVDPTKDVSSVKYTAQTKGMIQPDFDSYILLQYSDLNIKTSTIFSLLSIMLKLVPVPPIDGTPPGLGDIKTLNDSSLTPPNSISTAISQANNYIILMNNLIADINAVPVSVWNGSKSQKLLGQISINFKNNLNASQSDIANDLSSYQIALMKHIIDYLSNTVQGKYAALPPDAS